jgi:hypothetical protein
MAKRPSSSPHRNQILSALSSSDSDLLDPHLSPLLMKLRHVCEEPNKSIRHVYFMEEGIASVVAVAKNDKQIEVGIIDRRG